MEEQTISPADYAANLSTQLRKGFLAYCILKLCGKQSMYTSDIITHLRNAELVVVEGTVYPLLSRLQKDGLLTHTWQESELGPPRKYYQNTSYGDLVMKNIAQNITQLNATLKKL